MELFPRTVVANNTLFARTVPVNNTLFAGTVPVNNTLFAGTVPAKADHKFRGGMGGVGGGEQRGMYCMPAPSAEASTYGCRVCLYDHSS